MSSFRMAIMVTLVIGLFIAAGCSSSSITDPGFAPDRLIDGNGSGEGSGDGGNGEGGDGGDGPKMLGPGGAAAMCGPIGPNGPWADFAADGIRYFEVDYVVTLPDEEELLGTGEIIIYDAGSELEESEVMVKYVVNVDDMDQPVMAKLLPGNKATTVDGLVYTCDIVIEREGSHHSFTVTNGFELTVVSDEDPEIDTTIDGWFNRNRTDNWFLPNEVEKEIVKDWNLVITGIEVFPDEVEE